MQSSHPPNPDPLAAQRAAQASELRHRELVVIAVAEQIESVMALVRTTAHDEQWRGPASRAYARAIENRMSGLIDARRSLDTAGQAIAWARSQAEHRAATAAAGG